MFCWNVFMYMSMRFHCKKYYAKEFYVLKSWINLSIFYMALWVSCKTQGYFSTQIYELLDLSPYKENNIYVYNELKCIFSKLLCHISRKTLITLMLFSHLFWWRYCVVTFLKFSVGLWAFVIGLSKVSSFFSESRFYSVFQLLGECHCWWTKESPRAHVAKFYGRLRLICSVLRASNLAVLKLIEIVILWVYYSIPFRFSFFRHFWDNVLQPFQLLSLA